MYAPSMFERLVNRFPGAPYVQPTSWVKREKRPLSFHIDLGNSEVELEQLKEGDDTMTVAVENPKLIMSQVKVSASDMAQLAEIVTGAPVARAPDKATAFIRLGKAVTKAVGLDDGKVAMDRIAFEATDLQSASKIIEDLMKKQNKERAAKVTARKEKLANSPRVNRKFEPSLKIFPLVEENPRRKKGGYGWKAMEVVLKHPGITVKDYLAKGGRIIDLDWDLQHGSVKVE